MGVRYVFTTVLPRYTMSGAKRPAPPARTLSAIPDPMQNIDGEQLGSVTQSKRGHFEVVPFAACRCGHRHDHHRDWGDPRGAGCWLCECGAYDPPPQPPVRVMGHD